MKHLLALILIFSFSTAFSQNNKIDSLQQEVSKAKGTTLILQLNELAIAYWDVDLKKSITLGNEALKLSEQYKFYEAKARTYNIIGSAYFLSNNLAAADKYCENSLSVSKMYGSDLDRMKSLCNKTSYYAHGYRAKSFSIKAYLDELLALSNKRAEYELFASAVNNIIANNRLQQNTDINILAYIESLEKNANDNLKPTIFMLYSSYYKMNSEYFKSIENLKKVLTISNDKYVRLNCYVTLGDTYFNLRRFKESKKYLFEALKIYVDDKNSQKFINHVQLYFLIAAIDIELGDFKEAYVYAKKPILYRGFKESSSFTCMKLNNLGLIYLGLDSLKQAEYYINKSLYLSDSEEEKIFKLTALQSKVKLLKRQSKNEDLPQTISNITKIIEDVHDDYTTHEGYQELTDYYKQTGEYKKSLYYLEKWAAVNDSLKSTESLQIFNEFQTKYETEKKEQQIVLQDTQIKSQHRFLIVLSISGVLLLIAFVFIFILYNKRNQAYKRLVFQSIDGMNGNFDSISEFATNEKDISEEVGNEDIKATQMSDEQKLQLIKTLTEQMDKKVYLQPDITINKLAELCSTNRTYLSQLINEYYLMNFSAFINKYRIEEAKNILIADKADVQLKNLYPKLGFNSYTVFNDAFKKYIGVTPAFFLRTVKEEKQN